MTNKERIAYQIHQGSLNMPTIPKLKKQLSQHTYREIENMFSAMWYSYLKNGKDSPISLPYWAKRVKNQRAVNFALKTLSLNGWIKSISIPGNNWGEAYLLEDKLLQYVSQDTLDHVRLHKKFKKYMLKSSSELIHKDEWSNNRVYQNGKKSKSKLHRPGFTKAGYTQFQFDTQIMKKYRNQTIHLINKGIEKSIESYPGILDDHANYREVGEEIVDNLIYENGTYISGERASDSRGRDIAGYLSKIGNPVQFKIARALLVIPEEFRNTATLSGLYNKYMFIAEALGWKSGTKQEKIDFGRDAYYIRKFNNSNDVDDFFEDVWLERLYNDIDGFLGTSIKSNIIKRRYKNQEICLSDTIDILESEVKIYKWQVPIEID